MRIILGVLVCSWMLCGSMAYAGTYYIGRCGGKSVRAITLGRACKKNPGTLIFKCKRKCVKRKFLKCVKRRWKIKKSKRCSKSGSIKIRRCSARQMRMIVRDWTRAKGLARRVRSGIYAALRRKHSRSTRRKLKKAKRKINRIIRMLGSRVRFTCRKRGRCRKANAHTVLLLGRGMRICDGFLSCKDATYRAAVIIHELAHKTGALDLKYFSQCGSSRPRFPTRPKRWASNAESFEYWARFGFCIPGKTCR